MIGLSAADTYISDSCDYYHQTGGCCACTRACSKRPYNNTEMYIVTNEFYISDADNRNPFEQINYPVSVFGVPYQYWKNLFWGRCHMVPNHYPPAPGKTFANISKNIPKIFRINKTFHSRSLTIRKRMGRI